MAQLCSLRDARQVSAALEQLQIDIEAERSELARTLHDVMGGLLVGAIMDMIWISQHPGLPQVMKDKLARAQGLLRAAIDMERDLIENIRPTLLDNVGLFSALQWHLKKSCAAVAVPYFESSPGAEANIGPKLRIAVFRIFQEALKQVLSVKLPSELSLKVEVLGDTLHCHLMHLTLSQTTDLSGASEESLHHRVEHVGGTLQWNKTVKGHHMHLAVPLLTH